MIEDDYGHQHANHRTQWTPPLPVESDEAAVGHGGWNMVKPQEVMEVMVTGPGLLGFPSQTF